jgi:two-component system, LytTR family, response regulator
MNSIRALVVDDEKPARERLRRLLSKDARVQLAGCCAGGAQALEFVRNAAAAGDPIRLVFLDVQMPEVDGFSVASSLVRESGPQRVPAIVFVTAHDEYALRAFEAHAIDYLLKPFSDERFQATVDRAIWYSRGADAQAVVSELQNLLNGMVLRTSSNEMNPASAGPNQDPVHDKIVLRGPHGVRLLPVEQITWIEADGMYVKLHTRDGRVHLHRGLLGSLDSSLDNRQFVRIHRSTVVNIDLVSELQQDAHGDYIAVLRDDTELRVGRRFRPRLEARLGQLL